MNLALPPGHPLRLCSAALEIATLPPERLLAAGGEPTAAFLAPNGESWVGMGAVRWLTGKPGDAHALWAGLADVSPDAPPPTALGVLPFSAREHPDALWAGLLPGGVVLPERLVVQRGGRAWLRLTLPAAEADTLRARLTSVARELAALPAAEAVPLPGFETFEDRAAARQYTAAVGDAVARIRAGELVKVVLARRASIAFDGTPTAAAVLRRLSAHQSGAVRYAWCRGGKAWLGATPETLLRLDGRTLRTEALAGTRPEAQADELHADAKERHEHAVVVDAVRAAIAPWVQALPPTRPPGLRRTRGLAHLHTPIEATLSADTDALALVHALHPTPAVCGLPTARAAQLLASLEGQPRGLYAGPVLRLSADGTAHAVVGLRGAVLSGRLAVLPAGAGIVEGSDGDRELAETCAKQGSVLDAWRAFVAA